MTGLDEPVTIEAKHLQEVLARLTDRRIAVEKELSALGEAKKGANDIFRHCRGFERAYSIMLQEANTAFKIRAVVEGSLPESLHKIPIEKRFTKDYVRNICREADGYRPHLVSPEKGIKRLVQEAMMQTSPYVHKFVDEIHLVLQETVREAARRSVLTEAGISDLASTGGKNMEFLRLKGFENAVIQAANKALEEWREEAHKVAETMVQMECDYVTPSFFRELEKEYQSGLRSDGGIEGAEEPDERMVQMQRGQMQHSEGDSDDDSEAPESSPATARSAISRETSPPAKALQQQLPPDMKAGWLEKRSGDSSSLNALPVDSWKWQKRWFVLAMESGFLYYFKSPQEMSTPGVNPKVVTINLRDCLVEDFDAATQPSQKRSTQKLDNRGGAVSLLIRISHKNPAMSVAKNHHQIVLRAADAAEKFEWLARLRNASDPRGGMGRAGPLSTTSQQLAAQQQQQAGAASAAGSRRTTGSSSVDREAPAAPGAAAQAEKKGFFGRAMDKVSDRFGGFGGSKLGSVTEVGSIEDLDAYYERLGTFTGLYARHIFNRMSKTVPKAIILCQVIRSRDRLLDQLYTYLMSLKDFEIDALLAEDPTLVKRRNAAQLAARELSEAQGEVKRLQEVRAASGPRAGETAEVSVGALLLAGAYPLIPPDKIPKTVRNPGALYGEFTPVTLLQGVGEAGQAALQLGAAAFKAAGRALGIGGGSSEGEGGGTPTAAAAENGPGAVARSSSADGTARPGSAQAVAPSPSAAAGSSAAAKPRRQPPPPPPKMT
ncbi:dynamin-related GTPase isoform A [Chlorella sorokiniana]|uniref:Dynamin-related GTPase isoform A n=1 Tax=Chlorella sorokiniana TaxID=3076 RepID=A0A2P6TL80_CHLSO|nr:dynamin-related GTPase isoform A [Chlorella sorokiniana]|eukprot:PRW45025.1 dynamin-related GTPase isoform A [Chlorella sorokiniana]